MYAIQVVEPLKGISTIKQTSDLTEALDRMRLFSKFHPNYKRVGYSPSRVIDPCEQLYWIRVMSKEETGPEYLVLCD